MEGTVLRERDLTEMDAALIDRRQAVLQHLDIPQEEALTYHDECLFACDPRLIKQEDADRVECPREQCMATVVAVSRSIPPDSMTTDQDTESREQEAVRVLRITPFSAYVYELVVRQEDDTYEIIEHKRLGGGAM